MPRFESSSNPRYAGSGPRNRAALGAFLEVAGTDRPRPTRRFSARKPEFRERPRTKGTPLAHIRQWRITSVRFWEVWSDAATTACGRQQPSSGTSEAFIVPTPQARGPMALPAALQPLTQARAAVAAVPARGWHGSRLRGAGETAAGERWPPVAATARRRRYGATGKSARPPGRLRS